MRSFYILFVLVACSLRAQSSPCDSGFCICRYSNKGERDIFSETVDCANDPQILERQFVLAHTVYSLDLSWNNLTQIKSSSLFRSGTLSELLLCHNRITDINATFELPQLKRLDLQDNELEYIHKDTFTNFKNLEYLNLANNKFTSFQNLMLHHLSNLKEIIFDDNNLGPSLDENNLFDRSGYGLTHKIESLSINGINLNIVHDNFFLDAYNLRRLSMARNGISDVFEFPFTLEYLDLSDNPIEEIAGEDFGDLVALKELKLNNLRITEVPAFAFSSLRALVSLEIERNTNLTSFSVNAFGQDVLDDADDFILEKFSIRNSRLRTLDEKLEVPFGQLVYLDLQGNLWHCNCKIAWIKKLQIKAEDYDHLRCFTPKKLYNSRIFELNDKYFSCQNTYNKHMGVAITVVCSFITLTAAFFWLVTIATTTRIRFLENFRSQSPVVEYTILTNTSINV